MSTKTIQGRGVPTRLAWWMTIAVMAWPSPGPSRQGRRSTRPSASSLVSWDRRARSPWPSPRTGRSSSPPTRTTTASRSSTCGPIATDRCSPCPVQDEPWGVAFQPDGSKAYVANTVSGTVSILRASLANGIVRRPHVHVPVGTEPYGLALTPNGTKLYVTNSRSDTVSVIDTATEAVIATIPVGPRAARPRDHERRRRGRQRRDRLRDPVPGRPSCPARSMAGRRQGGPRDPDQHRHGHGGFRRGREIQSRTQGSAPPATRSPAFPPAPRSTSSRAPTRTSSTASP